MGKFQVGDKVKVNVEYSVFASSVGEIKQIIAGDWDAYTVAVEGDSLPERGFFGHELDLLESLGDEALIELAETLDRARLMANSIEAAAPTGSVYGRVVMALRKTLDLIMEDWDQAVAVYDSIMADGNTVREAIKYVRENQ